MQGAVMGDGRKGFTVVDGKKPLDQLKFEDKDLATLHRYVVEHIESCDDRQHVFNMQIERLVMASEENTRSVRELTDETQGIVRLHRDIQGAARVGMTLQGFIAWLAKMGAFGLFIATGIAIAMEWIKKS